MDVNYSRNILMSIENARQYEFFFLPDPSNFEGGSDIDDVMTSCVQADCLHPCYGASHEAYCNSCSSGFMSFVTLENNYTTLVNGDDQLKDHITTLRETCDKCQVPHTQEMPIPQAMTITEWGMPIKSFVEYFPLFWRSPSAYQG